MHENRWIRNLISSLSWYHICAWACVYIRLHIVFILIHAFRFYYKILAIWCISLLMCFLFPYHILFFVDIKFTDFEHDFLSDFFSWYFKKIVLPMIVRMMTHSKTNHLTNQTAARRKQFVPESIKRLEGSSFFSASVIRCPFLCPGIFFRLFLSNLFNF